MKILYVTTISLTMNSFFKPHIEMLVNKGNSVDIACNSKNLELDNFYNEMGCKSFQVDFSRSPLSMDNLKAYSQLKSIVENGNYDVVHCHTPNASVITRLVCRKLRKKKGLKVFYTAHGFHFYKGAPKLNWMVYYPVEKFCSRFTDKLITINKEDYTLAKNKFNAKEVHYIPGVGIDLSKFENIQVDKAAKRQEIGVPKNVFLIISVGELSERKNHLTILQAMNKLANKNIHYIIVGSGPVENKLRNYVKENNLFNNVHFLGYRRDVFELYKISDICCFPSIHEGLPVALMEAMACGVPIICSKIRGNEDLIDNDKGVLIDPYDVDTFASAISKMIKDVDLRVGFSKLNLEKIKYFDIDTVIDGLLKLYF